MIFLFYIVFIVYEEVLYKLFGANNFYTSVINSLFYYVFIASILTLINYLFPKKIFNHILRLNTFIITFWYGACLIVKRTFNITLSTSALSMADQFTGGGFISLTLEVLSKNIYIIGLLLVPFLLCVLISLFYKKKKFKIFKALRYVLICFVSFSLFLGSLFIKSDDLKSLYFKQKNNDQNVEYLGVLPSLLIDVRKKITGFEETIVIVEEEEVEETKKLEKQIVDIDFDNLIETETNETIKQMHEYFKAETPSYTNEYTGIYEGKNLIYIMAESFDGYMVSEELTPTLYKMIHSGFDFTNFYSTTNLSTIGGEFQELTGLLPDLTMLSSYWREGLGRTNYYPYGLGNVFNDLGYSTFAYHNHTYSFQNRDVYLKALGFDNYEGCGNGIESKVNSCKIGFPESDVELIEGTYLDWINEDKFMVYLATVSGHMGWDFEDNIMSVKHKDEVADLDYSETVKAYIAANLELEDAMTSLLNLLEEYGRLEDTVIVLCADHHPYGLTTAQMSELAGKEVDETFEIYRSNLIIYNAAQEHVEVEKPCATIDVLPTTLNLFGVKYDSRLIVGKDILSIGDGLVIFSSDSWITRSGRYNNNTGVFTPSVNGVSDKYVDRIKNQVTNRKWASKNIMNYDYYAKVFKNSD